MPSTQAGVDRHRSDGVIIMQTQILIRRFDPARDAEALRSCIIEQQDFHRSLESTWPRGPTMVADYMAYLDTTCATRDGCILMADCDQQTVGFACVVASTRGESPDDPAPFAWIYDIFVRPAYRRRRVATLLMAEAEHFARSRGAVTLRLAVLARNEPARTFYRRRAFREYFQVLTKTLVDEESVVEVTRRT
jgi:GNAT superfamily N-acetyltransferase